MSVWFAVPSARPAAERDPILKLWRERGYRIALFVDEGKPEPALSYGLVCVGKYPGYSMAVNTLVAHILATDPRAEWIVTGGDDTEPDPNHTAEEIALECSVHFAELHALRPIPNRIGNETFGVCQPTGDRWGENEPWNRQHHPTQPAYIDRICGSPWMGRTFCERMYGGNGPMWPEYFHMFNDNELQDVCVKLGVLWQRRDLSHLHHHVHRGPTPEQPPEFLKRAYSKENWNAMEKIYLTRKAKGFPGHEPTV